MHVARLLACVTQWLMVRLWQMSPSQERYPIVDVRGRGLMVAAEFGEAGASSSSPGPARAGAAASVTQAAGKHGMLLLTAGARETVRFLPPLNVSEGEIDEALDTFEKSLADVFG